VKPSDYPQVLVCQPIAEKVEYKPLPKDNYQYTDCAFEVYESHLAGRIRDEYNTKNPFDGHEHSWVDNSCLAFTYEDIVASIKPDLANQKAEATDQQVELLRLCNVLEPKLRACYHEKKVAN
jgi:hypothetical protein